MARWEEADFDYDSDANELREQFIARMKEQGLTVVLPKDDELQIDIDCDAQYELFQRMYTRLRKEFSEVELVSATISKGGLPGRHIVVKLPFELETPMERIAFQAALGSDPMRELLSIFRVYNGDSHPTLLVEKKWEKK